MTTDYNPELFDDVLIVVGYIAHERGYIADWRPGRRADIGVVVNKILRWYELAQIKPVSAPLTTETSSAVKIAPTPLNGALHAIPVAPYAIRDDYAIETRYRCPVGGEYDTMDDWLWWATQTAEQMNMVQQRRMGRTLRLPVGWYGEEEGAKDIDAARLADRAARIVSEAWVMADVVTGIAAAVEPLPDDEADDYRKQLARECVKFWRLAA